MELTIHARNMEIPPQVEQYVRKKLTRIERHLPQATEAKVELRWEATRSQTDRVVAQVTLVCNGTFLRGEERGASVNVAIDAVTDVLDRQVVRYKGRLYHSQQARKTGGNISIRQPAAEEAVVAPAEEGQVVRVKRFAAKPMTTEEAIHQMELLGHDFFLFYNSQDEQFNVVYRRRQGDYGLLRPEQG